MSQIELIELINYIYAFILWQNFQVKKSIN